MKKSLSAGVTPPLTLSLSGGVTLVELLVSLAVLGIIGGVNGAILSAGLDSWSHIQQQLSLQQVSDETMGMLMEGGFDEQGLRDAVELKEARTEQMAFVPLWIDLSHKPNPILNKGQRFILEKQFKTGAAIPVGQVRLPESDEWQTVPVAFESSPGLDPKHPDDAVTFLNPIPLGSAIRVIYTPDASVHPETVMAFRFDPESKKIFRSYSGKTEMIPKRLQGVETDRLAFLYYDNLNRLLPSNRSPGSSELRRITGVKVYLAFSKNQERRESTSFTNVRNVQTLGVTISKGSVVPISGPQAVRAFSMGDLSGLTKREGTVELAVKSQGRFRWKIRLQFRAGEDSSRLVLERFEIQAPIGQIRTSGIVNQPVSRSEFVDLMSIDRTGLFDYDDDEDISDTIVVPEGPNFLEVTECDFETAALFIRP